MPELTGCFCIAANGRARERRSRHRKLVRHPALRASIIERIKHGWSPEQIAGQLAYERQSVRVCHLTIYRFAYSNDGQEMKLWRYLPESRARRRPRHARRCHGRRFSPELSILHRPDSVRERKQIGHWGMRPDPVPQEARQGEHDVAGRAGEPLHGLPAQQRPPVATDHGRADRSARLPAPGRPPIHHLRSWHRVHGLALSPSRAWRSDLRSATHRRHGRKALLKTPTGAPENGFREIPIRCRSRTITFNRCAPISTPRRANVSALERRPKCSARRSWRQGRCLRAPNWRSSGLSSSCRLSEQKPAHVAKPWKDSAHSFVRTMR